MPAEFDTYAQDYKELLRDPIRDRFATDPRFYTERKWILLRDYLARLGRSTRQMSWLDVGCGEGDLLRYGQNAFARLAGCDSSSEMMRAAQGLEVRHQSPPDRLPFDDAEFDLATAVCVFHHVEPAHRLGLVLEMTRVLRPGGIVCLIEHNAQNAVVRRMVKRIPVDVNAVLLEQRECYDLFARAGLRPLPGEFFLYLPERLYRPLSRLESLGRKIPLGGQYAAFGSKPS